MVRKTAPITTPAKLSTWLWRAPVKFALLVVFGPLALGGLYAIIASAFTAPENQPIATWPMMALMFAVVAWAAFSLIKRLPRDDMGQRQFVGIYTAAFFVSRVIGILGLMFLGFVYLPMMISLSMNNMAVLPWLVLVMTVLALVAAYVGGLQIINLYATYMRAINMGVPQWKAILTLPCSMLWMPGYILTDEKQKRATDIKIGATWYTSFVNWIVASPANAWLMFIVMILGSGMLYGYGWIMLPVFAAPIVIFGIWQWIAGSARMRKNIGGAFSTVAIIVNVLTIITVITVNVIAYRVMRDVSPIAMADAPVEMIAPSAPADNIEQ